MKTIILSVALALGFVATTPVFAAAEVKEVCKDKVDKAGKPVNIDRYIGKIPAIAVGNSDGDIEMLQYADSNPKPDLELLLHHDDADREFDYDHGTEKALTLAQENDWTVISIKKDFKQIFPHD